MEVYKIMRDIDRVVAQSILTRKGNREQEDIGLR